MTRSKCKHPDCNKLCTNKYAREGGLCVAHGGGKRCGRHNRLEAQCTECGGRSICEHKRQRSNCIDCLPLEVALERNLVCLICTRVKTKAAICRDCFNNLSGEPKVKIEATVRLCLSQFFPGIEFNKHTFVGGSMCSKQIDGSKSCEDKTKGGYPNSYIVTEDRIIYIGVDENRH